MRVYLALLISLLVLPAASALPVFAMGARYGAGTFTADHVPDGFCSDYVGAGAMTYIPDGSGRWELRTYTTGLEPTIPGCYIPLFMTDIFGFSGDVSASGAVVPRWVSGACGFVDWVVHPFPTPGAFRLTVDFFPPSGCFRPEVHYRWEMTVT